MRWIHNRWFSHRNWALAGHLHAGRCADWPYCPPSKGKLLGCYGNHTPAWWKMTRLWINTGAERRIFHQPLLIQPCFSFWTNVCGWWIRGRIRILYLHWKRSFTQQGAAKMQDLPSFVLICLWLSPLWQWLRILRGRGLVQHSYQTTS